MVCCVDFDIIGEEAELEYFSLRRKRRVIDGNENIYTFFVCSRR